MHESNYNRLLNVQYLHRWYILGTTCDNVELRDNMTSPELAVVNIFLLVKGNNWINFSECWNIRCPSLNNFIKAANTIH